MYLFKNESAHDKTYEKTCATSEDSDQPAHPRSLIRVFADRMYLLLPPGYIEKHERKPLPPSLDEQADLCLCWSHGLLLSFVMRWLKCNGSFPGKIPIK